MKKRKKTVEDIARFSPSYDYGLSEEQVAQRVEQKLYNEVKDGNKKDYFTIIWKNVFTFFNLIYLIIGILLVMIDAEIGEYTFVLLLVINTSIGIIQEIKAKITIDKLNLISAPTATVIRSGKEEKIKAKEVVLDDILYLTPGKEIIVDCIIVEGEIEVNESQLTGESVPIRKGVGTTIYSGSFVVSGNCHAQVERVGNDTNIAKLTDQAKKYSQPASEMMTSMNRLLKVISVLLVIFGFALFLRYFNWSFTDAIEGLKDRETFIHSISTVTTALIGMIPQGLYLMTTIALSAGVIELSKKNTLVQDIYCIEMLARVDVLCLDKTGTITDGTMSVLRYIEKHKGIDHSVSDIISSMNFALQETNSTSKALEKYFGLSEKLKAVDVLPFSSDRKFSAVTFDDGTYILGAPEFVLKSSFDKYSNEINGYANQGLRVLALAFVASQIKDTKISKTPKLIALILVEDQIRPEAYDTIKYFKENDVDVKVISGDNPITVSEVARRVGINYADKYISLDGLTDEEVYSVATKYTVFGRVKPNQKQILVKALKDAKHTVAMTGDGVNDILAMKEADCSIAMASGSDAVRSVANLTLLDSNFASMPEIVKEGRRVINNVQQTSILFLVKTLFVIILSALTIVGFTEVFGVGETPGAYPITNKMSLFILEIFAIGIPSVFLAVQKNEQKVHGNFLKNAIRKSLPGAIAIIVQVIIAYLVAKPLGFEAEQLTTIIVLCATYTAFMVLFIACQPFNTFKVLLYVFNFGCALFITLLAMFGKPFEIGSYTFDFSSTFEIVPLVRFENDVPVANPLLMFIILALISYTLITAASYFLNIIEQAINKNREKRKKKQLLIEKFGE